MSDFLHPAESVKSTSAPKQRRTKKQGGSSAGVKKNTPPASVSDGLGVNLMSQDSLKRSLFLQEKKSAKVLGWSIFAGVLLTVFLFVGVKAYGLIILQRQQQLFVDLGHADSDVFTLEKNADALNQFTSKLEVLKSLFDNHVYWSQFISAIEKYTLPSVSYDALSVAPGSTISFSATAPDFRTLGRQLMIFQKEASSLMSSVKITSGQAQLNQQGEVSGVSFEVSFTMNPDILKKTGSGLLGK